MKIVKASYEILAMHFDLELLERCGRTCYKSEEKITEDSAPAFAKMLLDRGHHAMVEFGGWMAVKFVCDRGVSHELVRHRLFSFAQESTRYCNYGKDKFGSEITVIDPRPAFKQLLCAPLPAGATELFAEWLDAMETAEAHYIWLIKQGASPQMARSVLPNSLKTEVNVAGNAREWRHFFSLRAAKPAHPQMREVACPLLRHLRLNVPMLFDDVGDVEADQ